MSSLYREAKTAKIRNVVYKTDAVIPRRKNNQYPVDRYRNVDWSKSGSEIARELGVTRQAVSHAKLTRGISVSPKRGEVKEKLDKYFASHVPERGMSIRQVAREVGCSPTAVATYLRKKDSLNDFHWHAEGLFQPGP